MDISGFCGGNTHRDQEKRIVLSFKYDSLFLKHALSPSVPRSRSAPIQEYGGDRQPFLVPNHKIICMHFRWLFASAHYFGSILSIAQLAVDYPKNRHGLTCALVERCLIKKLSNSGLRACLGQAVSDNARPVAV
jgi:hypothetical protein